MAVRIDSNGEYLQRNQALSATWAISVWVNMPATGSSYGGLVVVSGTGPGTPWHAMGVNPGSSNNTLYIYGGAVGATSTSYNIGTNQWVYLVFYRNGTTSLGIYGYRPGTDGSLVSVRTLDGGFLSAITNTDIYLGSSPYPDPIGNARFANVKVWDGAVPSTSELFAEKDVADPIRTTNLWAYWPLETHTDLTDHSGNGRNLTGNGTLSTETGPDLEDGGDDIVVVPQVLTLGGYGPVVQRTGGARAMII